MVVYDYKTTGTPISKESVLNGITVEWVHVNSSIEKDLYYRRRSRRCLSSLVKTVETARREKGRKKREGNLFSPYLSSDESTPSRPGEPHAT